jgi:hypothetical protein
MTEIGQKTANQLLTAQTAGQQAALQGLVEADQGQRIVPVRSKGKRFQA